MSLSPSEGVDRPHMSSVQFPCGLFNRRGHSNRSDFVCAQGSLATIWFAQHLMCNSNSSSGSCGKLWLAMCQYEMKWNETRVFSGDSISKRLGNPCPPHPWKIKAEYDRSPTSNKQLFNSEFCRVPTRPTPPKRCVGVRCDAIRWPQMTRRNFQWKSGCDIQIPSKCCEGRFTREIYIHSISVAWMNVLSHFHH